MSRNDFNNQQQQQEEGGPGNQRPTPRMRGLLGWVLIGGLIVLVVWAISRGFGESSDVSRADLERLLAKP
ncbi:MAG: hypothetical protein U9R68_09310, partial [Planctomycetota bacterium]|nr:hypothetical protein [Planctomycetota bacterium]